MTRVLSRGCKRKKGAHLISAPEREVKLETEASLHFDGASTETVLRLTKVVIISSIFWLLIMLGLSLADFGTRTIGS